MSKHRGKKAKLQHELAGFVVEFKREAGQYFHSLRWKPTGKHRKF